MTVHLQSYREDGRPVSFCGASAGITDELEAATCVQCLRLATAHFMAVSAGKPK